MAGGLGISIERATAMIAHLMNMGEKASRAGTGLRRMLGALLKPTNTAREVFAKYGIAVADLNIQHNDLADVLKRLRPLQKEQADLARVFGLRGWQAANSLIGQLDAMSALERKITGTNRAFQMQREMMDTLHGSIELLKNAWNVLKINIGDPFSKAFRPTPTAESPSACMAMG